MVGWYILGAVVLLLLALWLLPVGVSARFGEELRLQVYAGPVKITLLPKPPGKKKKEAAPQKEKKAAQKPKDKKRSPFTFADVKSAAPVLWQALEKTLGKLRRRLRIDPLDVAVVFAGPDPAQVAEMYGWACAAMWNVMPRLEQLVRIPDPRLHLDTDYSGSATAFRGRVGARLRVGDAVVIVLTLALPVLKWYLGWRKQKKEATKNV